MAFFKLFQLNTGVPASNTIQSNTLQVYANASGALVTRTSGQSPVLIGSVLTGALQASNTIFTGVTMGGVATNTGIWIPVTLSGINYAVPAFRYI